MLATLSIALAILTLATGRTQMPDAPLPSSPDIPPAPTPPATTPDPAAPAPATAASTFADLIMAFTADQSAKSAAFEAAQAAKAAFEAARDKAEGSTGKLVTALQKLNKPVFTSKPDGTIVVYMLGSLGVTQFLSLPESTPAPT